MQNLPNEVKLNIIKNLPLNDLLKICQLDSKYNSLCRDNSLWKKIVQDEMGEVDLIGNSYYQTYLTYRISRKVYVLNEVYLTTKFYMNQSPYKLMGVYHTLELAMSAMINYVSLTPNEISGFEEVFSDNHPEFDQDIVKIFFGTPIQEQTQEIYGSYEYQEILSTYLNELPAYLDSKSKIENNVYTYDIEADGGFARYFEIIETDVKWS